MGIKSIDIDNTCPPPPVGGRIIFEVQDIRTLPKEYFKYFPIDIAIDDGSHNIFYQIHCINAVYPALNSGGLLIIEDVMDFENNKISFDELKIPYEIIDKRNEQLVADEFLLIFRK
jgi:hypothetical protein